MAGMSSDVEVLKDIPGYKAILKSVLKSQIQMLVEQLSEHTGEETILLTASVHDGTLSHQGSNTGRGFLEGRDEIKSQFLGYCLKSHHKKKVSETRSSPYQRPQSGIQGERTPSNQGPSKKVPRLQLQPQPVSLQRVVAGDSGLGPGLRPPDMQRAPSQVFDENRAESSAVSVKLESNDSSVTSSDLDNYSSATVTFSSSVQHDQSLTSGDVHSENNESQNSAEDSTERTSDNEDTSATSACIKIEPINENEMELEITGVEPGKVTTPTDSWSHTQSNFGAASTSGPVEPGTSDSIYSFQKDLLALLYSVRDTGRSGKSFSNIIKLPQMKTFKEFDMFEDEICNSTNFKNLKLILSRIGGRSVKEDIKNFMERLIHNSLMTRMNFTGKRGKFAFGRTLLYQAIVEAVQENHKRTTVKKIEGVVIEVLSYAPEKEADMSQPQFHSVQLIPYPPPASGEPVIFFQPITGKGQNLATPTCHQVTTSQDLTHQSFSTMLASFDLASGSQDKPQDTPSTSATIQSKSSLFAAGKSKALPSAFNPTPIPLTGNERIVIPASADDQFLPFTKENYGKEKDKWVLKRYICQYCGKRCMKPSDLTRHIKIHTGEYPYECPTCSKRFRERFNLNAHFKKGTCVPH